MRAPVASLCMLVLLAPRALAIDGRLVLDVNQEVRSPLAGDEGDDGMKMRVPGVEHNRTLMADGALYEIRFSAVDGKTCSFVGRKKDLGFPPANHADLEKTISFCPDIVVNPLAGEIPKVKSATLTIEHRDQEHIYPRFLGEVQVCMSQDEDVKRRQIIGLVANATTLRHDAGNLVEMVWDNSADVLMPAYVRDSYSCPGEMIKTSCPPDHLVTGLSVRYRNGKARGLRLLCSPVRVWRNGRFHDDL